jgi:hypothetical protein
MIAKTKTLYSKNFRVKIGWFHVDIAHPRGERIYLCMPPLLSAYTYLQAIFYSLLPMSSAFTYLIPLPLTAYMYMSVRYRIEAHVVPFLHAELHTFGGRNDIVLYKSYCKRGVL